MDLKPTFEKYFPENSKGGQCGVFAHKLVEFPPVGDSLAQKKAAVKKYGTLIENLNGHFQVGDVVITSDNLKNGHVFVVNNIMEPYLRATDSNWNSDERVHHNRLVPKVSPKIIGVIRGPLKVQVITQMKIKKILVMLSQIDAQNISEIKAGIQIYIDKVKAKTNNEFVIEPTYVEMDHRWTTTSGTSSDGNPIVFVIPTEITQYAHQYEVSLKKEFDTACLIYNNETVHGPQPTNPVQNPITVEGLSPIQIPLNWLRDGDTTFATSIFFAHENSHNDYYLVNSEAGLMIRDRTHDSFEQTPTYSSLDYFSDLLIELKPYWNYLTSETVVQGDPMLIYKFTDSATCYVLVDDATLIGITAQGLTKTLAGRPSKIVELAVSQRPNFRIVSSVVN